MSCLDREGVACPPGDLPGATTGQELPDSTWFACLAGGRDDDVPLLDHGWVEAPSPHEALELLDPGYFDLSVADRFTRAQRPPRNYTVILFDLTTDRSGCAQVVDLGHLRRLLPSIWF